MTVKKLKRIYAKNYKTLQAAVNAARPYGVVYVEMGTPIGPVTLPAGVKIYVFAEKNK